MSKKPNAYVCAVCGADVVRTGDQFKRACDHDNEPIRALISATAYGEAKVAKG